MKTNQIKNWRIKSYEAEGALDDEIGMTLTCDKGDVHFCGLLYFEGSDSAYDGSLIEGPEFDKFTDNLLVSRFISVVKESDVYHFQMKTDDDTSWTFKVKVNEGGGVGCELFE